MEAFAKMKNLRLLSVCNAPLTTVLEYHSKTNLSQRSNTYTRVNEFKHLSHRKTHLSGDFKFLSQEIRCLYWHGYPLKSLPSHFDPKYLFELDLCYSRVEQLWIGKKLFLQQLEFINLSHSKSLIRTPDFEGIPNLKRLILDGCPRLIEVHPSVGDLKKLIFLSLKDCENLKNFPSQIRLKSLEILILSGCSNIQKFPEVTQKMDDLLELCLDGTAIKELPSSIWNLSRVVFLNLRDCKNLLCLPESIGSLKNLRFLILGGCVKLGGLPSNLRNLGQLEQLDIGGTSLKVQPYSTVYANNHTRFCCNRFIGKMPQVLSSFILSFSKLVRYKVISHVSRLGYLRLAEYCTLSAIPRDNFRGISSIAFSHFKSLTNLRLSDCNLLDIPDDIFSLYSLTDLDLSNNSFVSIPDCIDRLSVLEYLRLNSCRYLHSLPALPASIACVYAQGCTSLEKVLGMSSEVVPGASSIAQHWDFRSFFLTNCFKLAGYRGMNNIIIPFYVDQLQSILTRQLLGRSASYAHIKIVVPGSDVPTWFSHLTTEPSLTIHLPPFRSSSTKLLGIAVCTVFTTNHHHDSGTPYSLDITVQFNEGVREAVCVLQVDKSVESDHLGLCYAAFPLDWRDNSGCINVSLEWNIEHMQMRRFGVRFLYYTDVENRDQINHPKYSKELWGLADPIGTGVPGGYNEGGM